MKRLLKLIIVFVLGFQLRRLIKTNTLIIIGVVGSIGKTSTKSAIAQAISAEYYVRYQTGNYNDIVTVPLVFFGEKLPALYNPLSWIRLFIRNEQALRRRYPYDAIVVELGTDGPGQIKQFKKYFQLDYAVVTAIVPEHMENFADEAAIAGEELSVQDFADHILVNADLCTKELLSNLRKPYQTYGRQLDDDFAFVGVTRKSWSILYPDRRKLLVPRSTISNVEVYSISAAVAISYLLGINDEKIKNTIRTITSMPGRMNLLTGKKDSVIIDDTYNSSPDAVQMALQTLYDYPAKQRIALLGSMNELGRQSEMFHRQVGAACDPNKLSLLVTLGDEANKYLAAEAERRGCKVKRALTPTEAAEAVDKAIMNNTVILAKGSQNGVFAEEAVKLLLNKPEDESLLVRQSRSWMKKKQAV